MSSQPWAKDEIPSGFNKNCESLESVNRNMKDAGFFEGKYNKFFEDFLQDVPDFLIA
jgi:hypothetical protein